MDLTDAFQRLTAARRDELQDHAFGDAEVYWLVGDDVIATGHFSRGHRSVSIKLADNEYANFSGEAAQFLRYCGKDGEVTRNDETGPDTYQEGVIMPGLTMEGVRDELTRPPEGAA